MTTSPANGRWKSEYCKNAAGDKGKSDRGLRCRFSHRDRWIQNGHWVLCGTLHKKKKIYPAGWILRIRPIFISVSHAFTQILCQWSFVYNVEIVRVKKLWMGDSGGWSGTLIKRCVWYVWIFIRVFCSSIWFSFIFRYGLQIYYSWSSSII